MKTLTPIKASGMLVHDPFGMITLGRSWDVGSGYRYGFNGMEGDDEIAGNDNALDFGARIYDARLGRWFSVDGLALYYPYVSPYTFALNSPIRFLDSDGSGTEGGFSVSNQSSKTVIITGSARYEYSNMDGKNAENMYGNPRTDPMDVHLYPGDTFTAKKVEEKRVVNGQEITVTKYVGVVTRANPQPNEPSQFPIDIYDVDYIHIEENTDFQIAGDPTVYNSGDNENTGQYVKVSAGLGNKLKVGEAPDDATLLIKDSKKRENTIKLTTRSKTDFFQPTFAILENLAATLRRIENHERNANQQRRENRNN